MIAGTKGFLSLLLLSTIGVILVAVSQLDSPQTAREKRLDSNRRQNIWQIATAIQGSHRQQGKLPASLEASEGWLNFPSSNSRQDPETGAVYAYRVTSPNTYELCAKFSRVSGPSEGSSFANFDQPAWAHPAGLHCFRFNASGSVPIKE